MEPRDFGQEETRRQLAREFAAHIQATTPDAWLNEMVDNDGWCKQNMRDIHGTIDRLCSFSPTAEHKTYSEAGGQYLPALSADHPIVGAIIERLPGLDAERHFTDAALLELKDLMAAPEQQLETKLWNALAFGVFLTHSKDTEPCVWSLLRQLAHVTKPMPEHERVAAPAPEPAAKPAASRSKKTPAKPVKKAKR